MVGPGCPGVVVLTVAHMYDRRPEAASLLNLAALCQRCHNRHAAQDRQLLAGQPPLHLERCRCGKFT